MDNNNIDHIGCHHILFEPNLISRRISPASPLNHQSCINFNFLVNLKSSVVLQNMDGTTEHFVELDPSTTPVSVELKFEEFMLMSQIREALFGPLVSVHMMEEERGRVVQCAWDAAAAAGCCEAVRSPDMTSGCVEICLDFEVLMEQEYVFCCEGRRHDYSMLKNVSTDVNGELGECCCICLEDLFGQDIDGEEVLCTPCVHVFHGQCIKNWLAATPSCPLCRFQINVTT